MKQTIEIEVPDDKKVVGVLFGDAEFQLPKTWEEFYSKYKGGRYFIEGNSTIKHVSPNYIFNKDVDRNMLPSEEAAKQHLAFMQLHQLRDCYRQGWKPDYKDIYCSKYSIVLNKGIPYVDSFTCTNVFLSFQSREIAKEFLNNFRELIKQAGDLI